MKTYTADFETTTDPLDCRVWAYGICEIGNEDNFIYGNNITDFIKWCETQNNITAYFHNEKFDGEFIIAWLFNNGFNHVKDRQDLTPKTFTTLISDKGQFYSMEICFSGTGKTKRTVKLLDSLKILPFSVEEIAKGFNLPIGKLKINYDEKREVGHELTPLEVDYLKNDVVIVAMALNVLFKQGLTKMTQGSNALYDYKQSVTEKNFKYWFPIPDYDADIRQSYRGGFTNLNPDCKGKDIDGGIILDVNSLYPSVMYYKPLPYGEGKFFKGKYKKDKMYNLYIQMLTCQFELKPKHIPTIQLKNNLSFVPTEYLASSNGEDVTLCLTSVDLELFFAHYSVFNVTYHSGWKFKSITGLFRDYIDKWTKVKIESTLNGNKAMRTLAKLMLNALYGKFALNPNVQSKIPYMDNGVVKYATGEKETRDPIYIPVGTFITSWARYNTITSAQLVYDRYLYSDTDSLHLSGFDLPTCLEIDPVKLGAWKHEGTFLRGRYLRQKSYIEELIITPEEKEKMIKDGEDERRFSERDGKTLFLNIVCAGMPTRCYPGVTWENFRLGKKYDGKLQMTHVQGGIVLKNIEFTLKA